MSKHIFEEGPRRGHAAGDTSIEQQASQLASDIKYKARQKMKGSSGSNLSPGQVQALYRQLLNSSPAPGAVKSIAKKKLFGEQIDRGEKLVSQILEDCKSKAFERIFEEKDEKKFVVRVTDRATGNTTYRKADRAKIAELRANKNISSVEITGRKEVDDAFKGDPKPNYGGKKAKKDYDGDGKVESGSKEHAGVVHNAIQRKKGGVADGQDTRKEEYVDEGLRSAVKRLLGKKDAPAEKKPESRGEQLRKKYNVGPEKSDTSAKRQILDRSRARAERDERDYGGSRYSKSVADKSRAAHDRYLRGGYSKYGANDSRGSGNRARRRAEALKKEDFNWLVDTLISEGYNLSSYTVDQFYDFCEEIIYEKEENGEKKLDVMKGKNKVNTSPNIDEKMNLAKADMGDVIKDFQQSDAPQFRGKTKKERQKMAIAAKLTAERGGKKLGEQVDEKDNSLSPEQIKKLRNKDMMLKQQIMLQKRTMQMQRQGKLPLNNEEAGAVRYCPKCDKDETREECRYGGEYWDKNSKPAEAEDEREIPTKATLFKNKLRARGIKVAGITVAPRNMKTSDDLEMSEATRYAKETGKDPQTGKPSVKGGKKPNPAFAKVSGELRKTGGMMSSRGNPIQPRGEKKEKGTKGYQGVTPVDRIKAQLARKRAPKPDPYGYGQGRYQGD